jgi:hypothetical protein
MDPHSPNPDDLSEIEGRLSVWRPSAEGLNRDAMLYAAGLAAGKAGRRRPLWPVLCSLLALFAAALGAWGLNERAERQFLIGRLHEPTPASAATPTNALVAAPHSASVTSPNSYLNLRRQLEQDPGRWLASREFSRPTAIGPAPPEPAILRASQLEALFNQ